MQMFPRYESLDKENTISYGIHPRLDLNLGFLKVFFNIATWSIYQNVADISGKAY